MAFIIISELMSQTVENHWTKRVIVSLEMKEKVFATVDLFSAYHVPVTDTNMGQDVKIDLTSVHKKLTVWYQRQTSKLAEV